MIQLEGLLIVLLSAYSIIHAKNTNNSGKNTDYFPITVGSYWKYDTNNGEMSVKIIKEDNKDCVISVSDVSIATSKEYFYSTGTEIMSTQREMFVFFLSDSYKYIPPFPRIKYPLVKGAKWLWEGKKQRGDSDFKAASIEIEVLGPEKVSVTAGVFDCVKLRMIGSDEEGAKEDFYQWVAADVGMVKGDGVIAGTGVLGALANLFGGGKITMELKSYNVVDEETQETIKPKN